MNANLKRRLVRLEECAAYSGAETQLICIHGGAPTNSGEAEADINGTLLVREPDEELEDFKRRALVEGRLVGARYVVIHGIPPRPMADDDLR